MSDPAAPNPQDFSIAEDEAIDWAILLADDPEDSAQLEQFKSWLAASPLHQQAWTRTQTVYAGLDKVQQLHYSPAAIAAAQPVIDAAKIPATSISINQSAAIQKPVIQKNIAQRINNKLQDLLRIKVLGGVAVSACLLVFAFPHIKIALMADFSSGTNEVQVHELEDGSRIFLAPETAVDIRFSDKLRSVNLLKGKVFFEVQSNPARPFQVNTDSARVTVLGTAFDVDNLAHETIISVAHGRVQVDDKTPRAQAAQQLTAGDQLTISTDKKARRRHIMLDDVARWRERELVARDMPIDELVDAFRPYYQGVILVQGKFAQTRVTGLYRLDDPVSTLTELSLAHGAHVRQISPWVLVLSQ